MKLSEIDNTYKAVAGIVVVTVFVLTYHNQFITKAEAMEAQTRAQDEIRLLRVDGFETEKRHLIREKKKAIEANKTADAEQLEQDIQTLRDKIKSLCDQLKDC